MAVLGSGKGARALPVIEIAAPGGNYDYEHKYFSDDTQYFCPAALPADVAEEVARVAVKAYQTLGCEGWGRADFILDRDNRPWLLEMNTSPGMTGHSLVPMAAKAVGISYADLCVAILSEASCKVHSPARNA
ncbi:D-alanine--D-alanine ligase B [compost metagenome]